MINELLFIMQEAASAAADAAHAAAGAATDAASAAASAATDAAAAASDVAADAAASGAALTEEVANPYSLGSMWQHGDFVAKSTLVILLVMSMGTWFILIGKLLEQQKILNQAKTAAKKFWAAKTMQEGVNSLEKTSAFRAVVEDGLKAVEQHEGSLSHQLSLADWVQLSLGRSTDFVQSRLQGGLPFLASVGSVAPFVGLFGTVWGIYHALIAIGLSGQASIDKVAGPVGEALIMTAIGLAVAVPAVLGYNWLVRRNKVAMENLRSFSGDIYTYLLSGSREAGAPAKTAARSH
ncbi:MotA/TolQ/ExbB proton channel family protein [Govanella unica]|uniref:Biopolymer transport protein ExbB n=1 Tax=Govanella unica TaxID=2975056 RepID=A0A9X3TZR3_9PROT|nr:MotA/TolQ/ExbB proton channel family protein [Govania unica]MDA5194755.1 MotA/TolQ/ExbB proton channel family protein [Govania unica]